MVKRNLFIQILASLAVLLILSSCNSTGFRILDKTGNCPVMLEARKFGGEFILRFTNQSDNKFTGSSLMLDKKYMHTWFGLYSNERGLIKDSTIYPHEICTLQFTEVITNQDYFDIKEDGYIPGEITLENKDCSVTWKFK